MSRINPALLPDDLDALYARADRLSLLIDKLSDHLGAVKNRIWELEEARGNPELRELWSDFYASR